MNLNPEFQRQLTLECSPSRLVGIPLVLVVIFTFCYTVDDYHLGITTSRCALLLFLAISLLWGARQSLESIAEEYRDRTWDTQRLSALSAWDMTWGKLLGSNIMVWYAAVICLLVYGWSNNNLAGLPLQVFYCLGVGLLVQSSSLLLGQLSVQRGMNNPGLSYLTGVLSFLLVAPKLLGSSEFSSGTGFLQDNAVIIWYDWTINGQTFHQLSLLAAIFWCVVGNLRLMMQGLGIRILPWVWLAFSVFLISYCGGFMSSGYGFGMAGYVICGVLTYVGVLIERNDATRLIRLLSYVAESNWRRSAEEVPVWCLSFILALPFAVQLSISEPDFLHAWKTFSPTFSVSSTFHFYPLAMMLMLLRDCAIYLYFSYGKNPQRAISLSLLTVVLLNGIIPGIFSTLGLSWLATASFPLWADSTTVALICAVLQTGLAGYLLRKRWREIS